MQRSTQPTSRIRRNTTEQNTLEHKAIPATTLAVLNTAELTMENVVQTLKNITGFLESQTSDQTLRDKIKELLTEISKLEADRLALQLQSLAKDKHATTLVATINMLRTELIAVKDKIEDYEQQRIQFKNDTDQMIQTLSTRLAREQLMHQQTNEMAAFTVLQLQTAPISTPTVAPDNQMIAAEISRLRAELEAKNKLISEQTNEIALMRLRSLSSSSFKLFNQTTTIAQTTVQETKSDSNKRMKLSSSPMGQRPG